MLLRLKLIIIDIGIYNIMGNISSQNINLLIYIFYIFYINCISHNYVPSIRNQRILEKEILYQV